MSERAENRVIVVWSKRALKLLAHAASVTAWTLGALLKIGGDQTGPYLPPDSAPKDRERYRP